VSAAPAGHPSQTHAGGGIRVRGKDILTDTHPRGEPSVSNGLALCKLHHAAFDANILGVRPDLVVEIRKDILGESDGLLLVRGLKKYHNRPRVEVPRTPKLRPRPDLLE